MDNEVSLTTADLETLTDLLHRANGSDGMLAGVYRFAASGGQEAVVSVAFDDIRGEHVITVGVFQVFEE